MRTIPINDLARSVSCLGMGGLGLTIEDRDTAFALLDAYFEQGGNLIDTAEIYRGGNSERVIGEYLQLRQVREQTIVLTKGCVSPALVRPDRIEKAIDGSLERLGLNCIDIYLLHRDDPSVPVGELVDVLNRAKNAGKIRSFGGSNWTVERLAAANGYARTAGASRYAFSSPHVGLAVPKEPFWGDCTHAGISDVEWYAANGITVIAWSAACRGFFAEESSPENHRDSDLMRVYHSPANFRRLARARELASHYGTTATAIAVAYVLSSPSSTVAVVGPRSISEVNSHAVASSIELSLQQRSWLRGDDMP